MAQHSQAHLDNCIEEILADKRNALPVSLFPFSIRTHNVFATAFGFTRKMDETAYIGQVRVLSQHQWLRQPNCGRKTLREMSEVMESIGLPFTHSFVPPGYPFFLEKTDLTDFIKSISGRLAVHAAEATADLHRGAFEVVVPSKPAMPPETDISKAFQQFGNTTGKMARLWPDPAFRRAIRKVVREFDALAKK